MGFLQVGGFVLPGETWLCPPGTEEPESVFGQSKAALPSVLKSKLWVSLYVRAWPALMDGFTAEALRASAQPPDFNGEIQSFSACLVLFLSVFFKTFHSDRMWNS